MKIQEEFTVSQARTRLAEIIENVQKKHVPVFLSRRGKRVAAIIDSADLEKIIKNSEDLEDLLSAEAAYKEMIETKQEPIPWEEVKKDLGLE